MAEQEDAELTPPHEHIRNTCVHMWGSSHCKQPEDWQEGSPITKAVWKDPPGIRQDEERAIGSGPMTLAGETEEEVDIMGSRILPAL